MTPRADDLDAVTFDAMGTLVALDDPVRRLRASLARRLGIEVSDDRCAVAFRAEVERYRAIHDRARDAAGLAAVRLECAGVLAAALPADVDAAQVLPSLTDAIVYRALPDAAPVLERLRAAGLRIAVISNWDVALHDALARTGLAAGVDVAVSSAEVGARKPDPAIFSYALDRLGVRPHRALHVGDDPVADVDGAHAAHLNAVLLARRGPAPRRPRIATLHELPALLDLDRRGVA